MMMWYADHVSGWGYLLMTLSMVAFWGLVIAGAVVLVRYLGRSQETGAQRAGGYPYRAADSGRDIGRAIRSR